MADDLKKQVVKLARAEGLDWNTIRRNATQMIVFGSRALNVHTISSDLDILCIGHGKTYKSRALHLIWVPESRLKDQRWLGSELATHVAAYGRWIKGENTWAFSRRPSTAAVERKELRVRTRAIALNRHWNDLLPAYRQKQLTILRRELQRLRLMRHGNPPIPSVMLDDEWANGPAAQNWSQFLHEFPSLADVLRPILRLASKGLGESSHRRIRCSARLFCGGR